MILFGLVGFLGILWLAALVTRLQRRRQAFYAQAKEGDVPFHVPPSGELNRGPEGQV